MYFTFTKYGGIAGSFAASHFQGPWFNPEAVGSLAMLNC